MFKFLAVPRQKGGSVAVAAGRKYIFLDLEVSFNYVQPGMSTVQSCNF